jgi:hypothetical protein
MFLSIKGVFHQTGKNPSRPVKFGRLPDYIFSRPAASRLLSVGSSTNPQILHGRQIATEIFYFHQPGRVPAGRLYFFHWIG